MKFKLFLIWALLIQLVLTASDLDPVVSVYSEIHDICNPTPQDLLKIQKKISTAHRPIVDRMKDTAFIAKKFKFYSEQPDEKIETGWIAVNSSPEERENCIITYASFNRNYPKGVKRLLKVIGESDFKGHFHYRIGGWPNVAAGDLVLAHVPFAFKPCFFKEVQKLGYKRVLWIDSAILPWVSLNDIFQLITERGFFVQANTHNVGLFMNEDSARYFGFTLEQTHSILSCSAAILGIDFTNPKTAPLIDYWHEAAKDPFAFFSARSDQNALSLFIYKMGLTDLMWPAVTLGSPRHKRKDTLFLMDREYVKDKK